MYSPLSFLTHKPFFTHAFKSPSTRPAGRLLSSSKGFTLLEILLVVAIIAILAGIVIVAINPAKQLGSARDSQRKSDINNIYKALNQYLIDNGSFPADVVALESNAAPTDICATGQSCSGVSISSDLVPKYLPALPKDPSITDATITGYKISRVGQNVYVEAPDTEIGFTKQAGRTSSDYLDAFVGVPPSSDYPGVATAGGGTSATNYALQFTGGNYVDTGSTFSGLSNTTIEFWFKTSFGSSYQQLFGSTYMASGIQGWQGGFYGASTEEMGIYPGEGTGHWIYGNPGYDVHDGAWHHFAATYDGTYWTIFVDGTQVGQDTGNALDASSVNWQFGNNALNNNHWEGELDEIRISNVARTYSGLPSHTLGSDQYTIAYWKFNDGPDSSIASDEKNTYDGTLVGGPSWVENTW